MRYIEVKVRDLNLDDLVKSVLQYTTLHTRVLCDNFAKTFNCTQRKRKIVSQLRQYAPDWHIQIDSRDLDKWTMADLIADLWLKTEINMTHKKESFFI